MHGFITAVMARYVKPELSFRACLGVICLASQYDQDRFEQACRYALELGTDTYRGRSTILETGVDLIDIEPEPALLRSFQHPRTGVLPMITTDTLVSHPLADRFTKLRLPGMCAAFLEQIARRHLADMAFEDRLALLIDRELTEHRARALRRRLKKARLHHQDACFEAIDLGRSRGLDRSLILGLADCD